jgi:SAM-dependent methyltransferase
LNAPDPTPFKVSESLIGMTSVEDTDMGNGQSPGAGPVQRSIWDDRFDTTEYVYGTAPNDFLVEAAALIPPGPVLSLAEGEGRNAVFLAERGHPVTAVDASTVGLAKAARLAAARGVAITAVHADLAAWPIAPGAWSGIVSIFCHLPPAVRVPLHVAVARGLAPGGVFVCEAYRPAQLAFGTGGPRDVTLLPTLEALRSELPDLEFVVAREVERDIHEGALHQGRSAVVQVSARRPPGPPPAT